MGYDRVSMRICAKVSRDNSERDDQDDARWAELRAEIQHIVAKYEEDIDAWIC